MQLPRLAPLLLMALIGGCDQRNAGDTAPAPANSPASAPAPLSPNAAAPAAGAALPAADAPSLAVDPDGLRWFLPNGSARPLPFGAAQAGVLTSLETVRGPAAKGANPECGAGPVEYANWPDGLSLTFQGGRFVGWSLDDRASGKITTVDGIGPGATRAQVVEAFGDRLEWPDSTLGAEFSAGAYSGLMDDAGPGARVSHLWAGVNCVAR